VKVTNNAVSGAVGKTSIGESNQQCRERRGGQDVEKWKKEPMQ
jgi:hypothetical protein